jgi:ribosomal subunit interface protein
MRIVIRANGVKFTPELREGVKRRVGFALGRFGEHIGQVTTRFWTRATPTSSDQKHCQIEVELKRPKTIKAETVDADPLLAADRAANRLARSIIREMTMNRAAPAISAATHAVHAPKARKTATQKSKEQRGEPDGIGRTRPRKDRKQPSATRRKA